MFDSLMLDYFLKFDIDTNYWCNFVDPVYLSKVIDFENISFIRNLAS